MKTAPRWPDALRVATPALAIGFGLPTSAQPTLLPAIVTTDATQQAALQTTPGVDVTFPQLGTTLDVTSVVDLLFSTDGGATFTSRCTGSLLAGGTQILTASHCIDRNDNGVLDETLTVRVEWDTPTGVLFTTSTNITLHPDYSGNLTEGNDIALIDLGQDVSSLFPTYDIYRGNNDIDPGSPIVKVGYGTSGTGTTGNIVASGTKRAGLNSYDDDARDVLDALTFFPGQNPFGGSLPDAGDTLAYDFDDGTSTRDAIGDLTGVTDLGFGDNEVMIAPGDSGGPGFIEANDSQLTLAGGGDVGSFIVGSGPTTDLTIQRDGRNSTTYDLTISGDSPTADQTAVAFAEADDLSDFKVLGVSSYIVGTINTDLNNAVDATFGEFAVDSSAAAEQAFIDSSAEGVIAPSQTYQRNASIALDDATAGNQSVTVTLDNLATTSELAGLGSTDANDVVNITATALDASNFSFLSSADVDAIVVDFGLVDLGEGGGSITQTVDLFNLVGTTGFTAALDLDAVTLDSETGSAITHDLTTFTDLAAGDTTSFTITLDTSAEGLYSAVYDLTVSDEDIFGEISTFLDDAISILAEVARLPGDYNGDGFVDGADYTFWANRFGGTTPDDLLADGNGDGFVDGADYTFWANRFGNTSSLTPAEINGLFPLAAVPEPSTAFLVAGLSLTLSQAGRRRPAHSVR
ncbi:MAG: trypsin-like serine protease [Planctomycetota bacterium]